MTTKSVELNSFSRRKKSNTDIGWILLVRLKLFIYHLFLLNEKYALYLRYYQFLRLDWVHGKSDEKYGKKV